MAKEIENININGEAYEVGKIYSKMGLSFERFVELLERDFYCPVLASDPTTTTTTYTDTDGENHDFQRGQFALVADASMPEEYRVWQCLENSDGAAVWKLWSEESSQPMVSTTWAELKAMRDGATLVPGTWYRITDYMTTTSQEGTQSAGHQFDVVVLATGTNTLSEEARAAKHEGDTYFTENGANLDAWKIWYCLDNDKVRFPWADVGTGKSIGIDIFGNGSFFLLPYAGTYEYNGTEYHKWGGADLGGMFFLSESESPSVGDTLPYILAEEAVEEAGIPVAYTTDGVPEGQGVIYRMVDENRNDLPYDFKNIMFRRRLTDGKLDLDNGTFTFVYTFNLYDVDMKDYSFSNIGCNGNIMKAYLEGLNETVFLNISGSGECHSNTFGNNCHSNTFGDRCYSNTFGDGCDSNTFGDRCYSNTFGDGCDSNTFGNSCYFNTFGDTCFSNTFGDTCYFNTFGGSCYSNTFGNSCYYNTFGNSCCSNTFGDGCDSNTFGNSCYSNTFGDTCDSNTFGNTCYSNTFGEPLVNGASRYKLADNINSLVLPVEANRTYETKVAYNSNGELKIYCEADLIN